ncbi:uncharacterized protein ACMZJ9_020395 isoform 2-T2 [Mantella aurantiaca]
MVSIFKGWKKTKKTHVSPTENDSLLPRSEQQKQKNAERVKKGRHKLKSVAEKINHTVYNICKPKRNQDFNSDARTGLEAASKEREPAQGRPSQMTDKHFKVLMENFQYHEVCLLIGKSEDGGAGDGKELYCTISQKMWEEVSKALAGDQGLSDKLQIISQCIKWSNETKDKKDHNWGPRGWTEELKALFIKHIKDTMPKFDQKNVNKRNLEDYLEKLKRKISEITSSVQMLPVELTYIYFECFHVYLLHELTSMANRELDYEEQVLLYKWTDEEHGKLCKYLQGSADFDMRIKEWFFDNVTKIESTGQKTAQKVLQEMLQNEIVWNSYPSLDVQCYFNNIQEKMTSICEPIKDISAKSATRLNCIFWEEFLKFLTRDTLLGLDYIQKKSEIRKLLDQCEIKGIEIVLRILSSKLKRAFKNYFNKNTLDYKIDLVNYRTALRNQGLQDNKKFNTTIQHRITILYVQSFFNHIRRNDVELFVQGIEKLKEFFSEWVSDKHQLGEDPLKYMAQILTASDIESLRTTTVFFLNEHQDVRKEHLMAILKIKGGINREDKKNLLYYVENRKTAFGEQRLNYFEDVKIECFNLKYLLCCQCLCA